MIKFNGAENRDDGRNRKVNAARRDRIKVDLEKVEQAFFQIRDLQFKGLVKLQEEF